MISIRVLSSSAPQLNFSEAINAKAMYSRSMADRCPARKASQSVRRFARDRSNSESILTIPSDALEYGAPGGDMITIESSMSFANVFASALPTKKSRSIDSCIQLLRSFGAYRENFGCENVGYEAIAQ